MFEGPKRYAALGGRARRLRARTSLRYGASYEGRRPGLSRPNATRPASGACAMRQVEESGKTPRGTTAACSYAGCV